MYRKCIAVAVASCCEPLGAVARVFVTYRERKRVWSVSDATRIYSPVVDGFTQCVHEFAVFIDDVLFIRY